MSDVTHAAMTFARHARTRHHRDKERPLKICLQQILDFYDTFLDWFFSYCVLLLILTVFFVLGLLTVVFYSWRCMPV